jgi:hypothetical protein
MKPLILMFIAFVMVPRLATTLYGQTNSPAAHRAQLKSPSPETRVKALQQLGALGSAAKSEVVTVEKCLKDPNWEVRITASRTIPQLVGVVEAAKTFDRIARDAAAGDVRDAALIGLENCGTNGLPTVAYALKANDAALYYQAVTTACKLDTGGTLYNDILPMLVGQPDRVVYAARKYLLANGIRRFYEANSRWPTDFVEIEAYVRKSNPLITLAPLIKNFQIRFEPEADGGLKVRTYTPQSDGSFKTGKFYIIQKPER